MTTWQTPLPYLALPLFLNFILMVKTESQSKNISFIGTNDKNLESLFVIFIDLAQQPILVGGPLHLLNAKRITFNWVEQLV